MHKYFMILGAFACAGVLSAARVSVRADLKSAVYKVGEKIIFNVAICDAAGKGIPHAKFNYELKGDRKVALQSSAATDERGRAEVITKLDCPGFLQCQVVWQDGKKTATGIGGAGVAPEKIAPAFSEPADFDAFWAREKAALGKLPMQGEAREVTQQNQKLRIYDVTVNCTGNKPVRGLLTVPAAAKPESLPALLTLHGAGVRGAYIRQAGLDDGKYLLFDINAHGIDNLKSDEFYRDLAQGELRRYMHIGSGDRDKIYFKAMYLRAYRALQYLKSRSEWDGRNLAVFGASQGGGQALAVAGMDPAVTVCVAFVPALCDLNSAPSGRIPGWPRFDHLGAQKGVAEATACIDAVNFARRIHAPSFLSTGFIDGICNSAGVYAAYNAIPAKDKIIANDVANAHAVPPATRDAGLEFIRRHLK